MKHTSKTLLAAMVGLSVALPLTFAQTQPDKSKDGKMKHDSTSSGMATGGTASLRRVQESSIEAAFTAKDLMGEAVYGMDGEKLGTVTDIGLGGMAGGLKSGMQKSSMDKSATEKSGGQKSSSTTGMSTMDRTAHGMGGATIFISTGGLFGVGDDLVSVPASQVSFDSSKERLTLNVRKADFDALAKQKATDYDSAVGWSAGSPGVNPGTGLAAGAPYGAAGSSATPGAYSTSSSSPASTALPSGESGNKKGMDGDVQKVRSAIQSDATVAKSASRVTVMATGDEIEIKGTVTSDEEHRKIVEVAKAATEMDIKDSIKVSSR